MKRNLCVAIIGPNVIGPFPSLTSAHRWGKEYTGVTYKLLSSPDDYDNDTVAEKVLSNPPDLGPDVLHDPAYIEQTLQEYEAEYNAKQAGLSLVPPNETRCRNCDIVISNEPVLNDWGFCTTSCEKEWNERHA